MKAKAACTRLLKDPGAGSSRSAAGAPRLDASNALLTRSTSSSHQAGVETRSTTSRRHLLFGYIEILNRRRNLRPGATMSRPRTADLCRSNSRSNPGPTGFVYRTSAKPVGFPTGGRADRSNYLMERFDAELIQPTTSVLPHPGQRPDRSCPARSSKPTLSSPGSTCRTGCGPVGSVDRSNAGCSAAMHLPEPNPFLPEELGPACRVTSHGNPGTCRGRARVVSMWLDQRRGVPGTQGESILTRIGVAWWP